MTAPTNEVRTTTPIFRLAVRGPLGEISRTGSFDNVADAEAAFGLYGTMLRTVEADLAVIVREDVTVTTTLTEVATVAAWPCADVAEAV